MYPKHRPSSPVPASPDLPGVERDVLAHWEADGTFVASVEAREAGVAYELEKVTDIATIMGFGVMATPALAINGQVKCAGKVPSVAEIKAMLA